MSHARLPRFRVRTLMIGVVVCALSFAIIRALGVKAADMWAIFSVGPLLGVICHRHWGGSGIVGGALAGFVTNLGFVCIVYWQTMARGQTIYWGWLEVAGNAIYWSIAGLCVGAILGTITSVLVRIDRRPRVAEHSPDEPFSN